MGASRTLVVGSGVGGLTLALLLAKAGRKVVLIEKQPEIGGYLRRFTRRGIRLDTGYHFSGGFNGLMTQMLQVLGIGDGIRSSLISNRIVLNETGEEVLLSAGCGHAGAEEIFCSHFPKESAGLRTLFGAVREIWTTKQMSDLYDFTPMELAFNRYDVVTVREFCDSLGLSRAAETAAGSFAACHGTPISQAPMSFHAHVGYTLYDDLSRPENGGDRLVSAFRRELEKYGVEIRTGTELLPFADADSNGECREARFTDGSVLPVEQVYFTIHPHSVLKLLPVRVQTPSFLRRAKRLRESTSFFCAYYLADEGVEVPSGLISYFSRNDLDRILEGDGYSTGYLIGREGGHTTISAFRTMPCGDTRFDRPHSERLHDAAYQEFKQRTAEAIANDLTVCYPQLKGHLSLLESGSPLTCRDYDPPTGSAYGVRCICGQSRLCGPLPVGNFFIAGQSVLVPGVLGTMLTSFAVFRLSAGEATYRRVMENA